ncbi:unnamed protein product [Phytophthora fragariaefolia]|uniref:Unnamed protein product n=1 Tax=Phytophthora fragariaefolia TaxID=1490495 RepID=A0A9W7CU42_9STRA|nr:unnamed protein product [Phytophthora fragariaefolia]
MARQTPRESPEIEAAIAAVQSGAMSLREAARKFDVPRTTLQRRVQRRASEAGGEACQPVAETANAQSDTSSEDTADANATDCCTARVAGTKRSAEHLDAPGQGGRARGLGLLTGGAELTGGLRCRPAQGHQLQDPDAVHGGGQRAGRAQQQDDQGGQVHLQAGAGAVAVPDPTVHCGRAAVSCRGAGEYLLVRG